MADDLPLLPPSKRLKASGGGSMGVDGGSGTAEGGRKSAPRRKRNQTAVLGDEYYNDEQVLDANDGGLGFSNDYEYCGPGFEGASGKPRKQSAKKMCGHPDGCENRASRNGLCDRHGGGRKCTHHSGCETPSQWGAAFCCVHGGGKRCAYAEGCEKSVQGGTAFCISHGGGKRCAHPDGCEKFSVSKGFCQQHGGGKKCNHESGCENWALSGCQVCRKHGAGKRCAFADGCDKGAQGGSPYCYKHGVACSHASGCQRKAHSKGLCMDHGGGRRCTHESGCEKGAVRKGVLCKEHGGGKKCTHPGGCDKACSGGFKFCYDHGEGKFAQEARDKASADLKQHTPWTAAETQAFEEAVEQHSPDGQPDWMAVARAMEGMRDQAQVFAWARLYIHQKDGSGQVPNDDGSNGGEADGVTY